MGCDDGVGGGQAGAESAVNPFLLSAAVFKKPSGGGTRTGALCERYMGAVLEGNTFRIWFHWPIANQSLPPKQDDYHHPAESLSEP